MDDVNDAKDETTDVESWKPGKHVLITPNLTINPFVARSLCESFEF